MISTYAPHARAMTIALTNTPTTVREAMVAQGLVQLAAGTQDALPYPQSRWASTAELRAFAAAAWEYSFIDPEIGEVAGAQPWIPVAANTVLVLPVADAGRVVVMRATLGATLTAILLGHKKPGNWV